MTGLFDRLNTKLGLVARNSVIRLEPQSSVFDRKLRQDFSEEFNMETSETLSEFAAPRSALKLRPETSPTSVQPVRHETVHHHHMEKETHILRPSLVDKELPQKATQSEIVTSAVSEPVTRQTRSEALPHLQKIETSSPKMSSDKKSLSKPNGLIPIEQILKPIEKNKVAESKIKNRPKFHQTKAAERLDKGITAAPSQTLPTPVKISIGTIHVNAPAKPSVLPTPKPVPNKSQLKTYLGWDGRR